MSNLHVDKFIDFGLRHIENEDYARWILNHFRLSANLKYTFKKFMKDNKLFCIYKGDKYRVTGASRLGDIWLAKDFNIDTGYDLRVCVKDIVSWSKD